MIRSAETVKIPDITALKKLIPDANFNTKILETSAKFRTYGNPVVWLLMNHLSGLKNCVKHQTIILIRYSKTIA